MTTLTTLLFGSASAGRQHLDQVLGPAGVDLRQFRVSGFVIEPPLVSGALVDLLDQPLSAVAANAWTTMTRVRRAQQRTLAAPGAREVVALDEHTITSTQEPTVEATLAGGTVTLLHLLVEVEIKVSGVRLVIHGGDVVRTVPGQARARATLSAEGAVLVDREFQVVDLAAAEDGPSLGIPA